MLARGVAAVAAAGRARRAAVAAVATGGAAAWPGPPWPPCSPPGWAPSASTGSAGTRRRRCPPADPLRRRVRRGARHSLGGTACKPASPHLAGTGMAVAAGALTAPGARGGRQLLALGLAQVQGRLLLDLAAPLPCDYVPPEKIQILLELHVHQHVRSLRRGVRKLTSTLQPLSVNLAPLPRFPSVMGQTDARPSSRKFFQRSFVICAVAWAA